MLTSYYFGNLWNLQIWLQLQWCARGSWCMRGKKVLRLHIYVPPIGQKGPFHGLSDMAVFLYSRMSSEHHRKFLVANIRYV